MAGRFICNWCNLSFTRPSSLRRHMKEIHTNSSNEKVDPTSRLKRKRNSTDKFISGESNSQGSNVESEPSDESESSEDKNLDCSDEKYEIDSEIDNNAVEKDKHDNDMSIDEDQESSDGIGSDSTENSSDDSEYDHIDALIDKYKDLQDSQLYYGVFDISKIPKNIGELPKLF